MISSQPRDRPWRPFLAGDGADHPDAEQLGNLDCQQTDAASCGMKQDRVAGLQARVSFLQPIDRR
jgi:hypothetical protein